ncbi:hypothetical protein NLG97_g5897 [Lecanicillium saksenae]|uniref:Uncharacterized protein n=1 Tax=Lecanicillium saksenae TaxID=468837 RepID=A0ACC1QTQ7_9HYPO|nr:hypothetical protein NLG97_g5897 [Lecanicillium saksenae]
MSKSDASNFCFPICILQNDQVKLVPFSIEKHAQRFYDITKDHDEMYKYSNNGPYSSLQHLTDAFLTPLLLSDSKRRFAYAVIDKTRPPSAEDADGELVGLFCYANAVEKTLSLEIGHVRVAPAYQRKGIAAITTALMVKYALDTIEQGGLGLLRVGWGASTANEASIGVALKVGFKLVGTLPYECLIENGVARNKIGNGRKPTPRSKAGDLWRDIHMFCITWEDWESEKRDMVLSLLGSRSDLE